MANPKVGQRDKQGRYWTGSEWKTLGQVMQAQQKFPGKTGETVKLPGVGEIKYTGDKYGWQTAATVTSRQQPKPSPKPEAPKPSPKPEAPKQQPPASSPETKAVSGYMSAAAAARKSGDAAQMAKVRDTGLDIWRKKYATTLAKNVNPDGTQKGTGQSVMAKQADELRNLRKPTAPVPQVQAKSSLPGGDYSPAATANMTQRTRNILGTRKEAYDIVLDYLLSQGHVDTLEEALYVMMEMDAENIRSIVEGVMPEPIDPAAHKAAQKTQKIYNLGKGTNNPNEAQSALKRTGPQLPGV